MVANRVQIVRGYLKSGDELIAAGDYEGAQAAFERGLAQFPEAPRLHLRLGQLHLRHNRYADADRHFRRVIETAPHTPFGYLGRGRALAGLGDRSGAETVLTEGRRRFPKAANFDKLLGDLHAANGEFDTAIDYYASALDKNPEDFFGYHVLSSYLTRLGRRKEADAVIHARNRQVELFVLRNWREILEFPEAAADDDFFQLGGDSLKAEQLLMEIEARIGVHLPLDVLLDAPTPRRLAAKIDPMAKHVLQDSVTFKDTGKRPALMLLHNLSGTLMQYRALCQYLHPNQPAFGLPLPGFALENDGDDGNDLSIGALSEAHLRIMTRIAPPPYVLCGHSYAGVIAFELACCCADAGISTKLVLLDSWPPISATAWQEEEDDDDYLRKVKRKLTPAAKRYRPREFAGDTLLITADEQPAAQRRDTIEGWRPLLAGHLSVETVAGNHTSLLSRRHAKHCAEALERYLSRWSAPPPDT